MSATAVRERRRARGFVRDYSYVRAEVRAILLLVAVIIVAISVLGIFVR